MNVSHPACNLLFGGLSGASDVGASAIWVPVPTCSHKGTAFASSQCPLCKPQVRESNAHDCASFPAGHHGSARGGSRGVCRRLAAAALYTGCPPKLDPRRTSACDWRVSRRRRRSGGAQAGQQAAGGAALGSAGTVAAAACAAATAAPAAAACSWPKPVIGGLYEGHRQNMTLCDVLLSPLVAGNRAGLVASWSAKSRPRKSPSFVTLSHFSGGLPLANCADSAS